MPAQFNIRQSNTAAIETLQKALGLPRVIAATLVARGITCPQQATDFLNPSLERDWENPYTIPGMREVVDGMEAAMRDGKRIVVFGDFDLDGISATAVLTRGLLAMGGQAYPFVPRRQEEGYGITEAAIERVMELSPDVLISVDCGISCRDEVRILKHRGVQVFITDHHEPAELVPEDVPVCNPKLDPECPSCVLAGVGVALKIVQALGARFGMPHLWREFTDLATLGTVADLVPMVAGNRALVADGVARMNKNPRPCIAALLDAAGASDKPVASTSLSFSIIPRLNAAGRMGDAALALDLLLEDDFSRACEKAAELEQVNDQRRAIEAELAEIATLQAQEVYHGQRALVVSGEGWHEGVKGIVASRLVRTYGIPTILFAVDEEGEAHGSGRSVGSVNLFRAVESCSDLLTRFGGHEAAVGVTLPAENLPAFTERLCAYMETLPDGNFHPRIDIDATVSLDELTIETVEELERLAPFGQENRQPVFLAQSVSLSRSRAVGADKNHFSTTLTDGVHQVSGIMFHCASIDRLMHCDSVVNAAFEVQVDEWRGRRSVKAMLSFLAPVRPCAALESMIDPAHRTYMADLYAERDQDLVADCEEAPEEIERLDAEREKNRRAWEEVASRDEAGLVRAITSAFIGKNMLFEAQQEVLDALSAEKNTLSVMATGRGKSLTFQIHAARLALLEHKASLFIYPLRALIADQAYHLSLAMQAFGVVCEVLQGESTPEERNRIFAGLASGAIDIVLTTPEFVQFHVAEFAACKRIGFVVVDEAHHIGQAQAGGRTAYAELDQVIKALGDPVTLSLTATAPPACAEKIRKVLGVSHEVYDHTCRKNLILDDQRNIKQRDQYLANMLSSGEKTVIYVNSRQQSVSLARTLRKQVPQIAPFIGFYNAGLSREDRQRVEELFRTGTMTVLVCTSAFGEGVNIPDIRHVVLYHMPFNEVEFNQMSGRAGRDGNPATIHLLFSAADRSINEGILTEATPDHDVLAQIYRALKRLGANSSEGMITASDEDIAHAATNQRQIQAVSPSCVACAIAVFRELGLITVDITYPGRRRAIQLVEGATKVELTDSVRYREGLGEIEVFRAFSEWVTRAHAHDLRKRIERPILPNES